MHTRQARLEDREAVASFTRDTWPDRHVNDYLPDVFDEWVRTDGPRQRTFVVDASDDEDGDVVGVAQCVLLSEYEAWAQGMRVAPAVRGRGIATELARGIFAWAHGRGAAVCRNMIFSWNVPSLALSRTVGFDPAAEFRWAHPDPDPDADPDLRVTADPDGGWAFWSASDARSHLKGLALDPDEPWALSTLTGERLRAAAADDRLLTVRDGGTRALAWRTRSYDREGDDGEKTRWAEYGVGAWADLGAARALFDAVARDAAGVDADETRVLIPETPRFVTDAAASRAGLSDEPAFALAADLTDESLFDG